VNIQLRSLRAAFGEAKRLRLIDENPFADIRLIRVPHKESKFLTEEEFSVLLRSMDDLALKHLFIFAVLTMMRLGEITNLRWVDVDLKRKEIHVRSSEEFRVKGGKPRIIPMNDWVYEFLASRMKTKEKVFTKPNGWPLNGGTVSRRFKKAARKAKLDDSIHFHSLRHTGISWLVNKGVPPQFVQRIAGHSSLNVTQVYTHLEDKNLISAVNSFNRIALN
jgi:integrase